MFLPLKKIPWFKTWDKIVTNLKLARTDDVVEQQCGLTVKES